MKKILFVCTGNTCRSPMAELCLKHKFKLAGIKGISVKSAGLSAIDGDKMNKKSATALKNAGIKPYPFKSRAITLEMINKSDLIICMALNHKEMLSFSGKAFTLAELTGGNDILDPFGGDQQIYNRTFNEIEEACNKILYKISQVLEESK